MEHCQATVEATSTASDQSIDHSILSALMDASEPSKTKKPQDDTEANLGLASVEVEGQSKAANAERDNVEGAAGAAIEPFTPESSLDEIRAVYPLLLQLSALARADALKKIAKKTKKSIMALREELETLEAEASEAQASDPAEASKVPNPDDYDDLFLAYCAAHMVEHNAPGSIQKVRERAEREGRMVEYETAVRRSELRQKSARDLESYSSRSGWAVSLEWDGRITQLKKAEKGGATFTTQVSSTLIITGEAHNPDGRGSVLVVMFANSRGEWIQETVARADMKGQAQELHGKLLNAGLRIGDWSMLLRIMQSIEPSTHILRIERPGWCGDYYALPSGEVLSGGHAIVTFPTVPGFGVGGTREGQHETLRYLDGNALFMVAYGAGLSAPVVGLFGPEAEPGGLHFYGLSSTGKSSILSVAASAWGRGADLLKGGVVANWKGTELGSEILCEQHSDCLLVRDEMNQGDPKAVGESLYMIGNGTGKVRGRDADSLRRTRAFRPTLLSSGEASSESYCLANGIRYMAGMAVRVLDISAAPEGAQGCFQRVPHEFEGAAQFAVWLKQQAGTHYGHHGRDLMRELLNNREAFMGAVRARFTELRADLIAGQSGAATPKTRDGQSDRVASRFALYGAVLMVAGERGVVPWSRDAIVRAFKEVHAGWLANRGGQGSQEGIAADRAFTAFVRRSPARFEGWPGQHDYPLRDRVGFTQLDPDGRREFWIASDEAFREMVGGAERVAPFVERLKVGLSEDWELVPGGPKRNKRDAPHARNLGNRAYCIRAREPENGQAAGADDQELGQTPDLKGFKLPNRSRAH